MYISKKPLVANNYGYGKNARTNQNDSNMSFGMKIPSKESKFFDLPKKFYKNTIVQPLARGVGKLLDTKFATDVIDKGKNNKNILGHLMTVASTVLSTLYIVRTLANKDLEEKKRNTLAINQALVFGVSTAMCYFVDGKLNKKLAQFQNKFQAANYAVIKGIDGKDAGKSIDLLKNQVKGLDIAKKVMIFDLIYRFIAPVVITPIANKIGNKLNENESKKVK